MSHFLSSVNHDCLVILLLTIPVYSLRLMIGIVQ